VDEARVRAPLAGQSLGELAEELRRRYATCISKTAAARRRLRDQLMIDAGQLRYDHIEGEFQVLARRLRWPASATLKDFRHLFSTCLQNAGIPEHYRKYFLGHALGRAPIVTYSHLTEDKVHENYQRTLATELAAVAQAIEQRVRDDLGRQTP
jgi:integrase